MLITHKIRNLNRYAPLLARANVVVCGIDRLNEHAGCLQKLGSDNSLIEGQSILPSPSFGPACRRNSEGWIEVHKDRPMETYSTPIIWRWNQWHGPHQVPREEMRYRSGERYPRTEHPPLGIELVIRLKTDGSKIAVLDFVPVATANFPRIVECINIMIEIFGECHLLTENLDSIIRSEIKKLNWQILPQGMRPWNKLKEEIEPLLQQESKGTRDVIENRLETINHFEPPMTAIGTNGFAGYLIFGFPSKSLFVLESIFFGNATYILGEDWEELSKMTKAQLISSELYKHRVVHREGWHREITKLLK